MPPPRRSHAVSDADLLTDMIVGEIDTSVDQQVAATGAPAGTTQAGDAQKVRLWGRQDKKVDPELLRERLQTTGLGQEAPRMVICQERPELTPLYMSPVEDPNLIDVLVKLAEYPFRPGLFAHLTAKDAVTEANRLDRLWQATLPKPSRLPAVPIMEGGMQRAQPMLPPAPNEMTMVPGEPSAAAPAQPVPVGG